MRTRPNKRRSRGEGQWTREDAEVSVSEHKTKQRWSVYKSRSRGEVQ
jgi:hypothetical protein